MLPGLRGAVNAAVGHGDHAALSDPAGTSIRKIAGPVGFGNVKIGRRTAFVPSTDNDCGDSLRGCASIQHSEVIRRFHDLVIPNTAADLRPRTPKWPSPPED
jgi:hypothetical protein